MVGGEVAALDAWAKEGDLTLSCRKSLYQIIILFSSCSKDSLYPSSRNQMQVRRGIVSTFELDQGTLRSCCASI